MSLIVFKVAPSLDRWAVLHNEVSVATYDTREEAERAALALAVRHPPEVTAEVDLARDDAPPSEIRIF